MNYIIELQSKEHKTNNLDASTKKKHVSHLTSAARLACSLESSASRPAGTRPAAGPHAGPSRHPLSRARLLSSLVKRESHMLLGKHKSIHCSHLFSPFMSDRFHLLVVCVHYHGDQQQYA
jgi:hypothetical protein